MNVKRLLRVLRDNICYPVREREHNVFDEPLSKEMKVMTYNVRCDSDKDGEHNWKYRRRYVADTIRSERAGIVCLQELAPHTLKYLLYELGSDYRCYDVDARNGKPLRENWFNGYGLAILYDKERFKVYNRECLWLSDTPSKPSRTWGNEEYRIAIRLKLYDKYTDKHINVINTHFDHTSVEIVEKSAQLLRRIISLYQDETFLSGDFNAEISEISSFDDVLFNNLSDDIPTFTGYHFAGTKVLDTIFTFKPYHRKVVIRKYGGHNASDHNAVVVTE